MKNTQNIIQRHFEAGTLTAASVFAVVFFTFPYLTYAHVSTFQVHTRVEKNTVHYGTSLATEMPTTYLSAHQ